MIAIPLKALDPQQAKTSPLFGKAPYVLLINPDGSAGVLQNEFTSGKELAAELVRQGVKTLITNHLGQKAYDVLSEYNINILHNDEVDSVLLSLDAYKAGTLKVFDVSMVQEAKHRNEGNCDHGEGDKCCGHEHGYEHSHGEKCCGNGESKGKGNGKRCCEK
jgi:predicted Fe-Mo cluster-binding NifX family protein